ncbi:conserved hypothetical protein [Theileria orientalis strain Shintoku]|uniref:SDE2-like domain-containing protein n=1 Tax=Theileria orientalis strain Shintoku TaxID=869250 RepID=J4C3U1_THEOR|nr:conserved hypothetical protein [Theileria orientalis strain Shintoku]BAM41031.1 conserved hypothetical protein [Theileria orientalis strain Shintoku]|eukprot:XP_009691332.1 conserved hypothetical protein [Theileria orientalis strain Shintoku]
MCTNLLISFPSQPTQCFQVNHSYLDSLDHQNRTLFYNHHCDPEDDCRKSLPCLKSQFFNHIISEIHNVDISKFYLLINGKINNNIYQYAYSEISDSIDFELKDEVTIDVLFKVLGGKGGFGKILKSQAKKKSQSSNLDSCRNLQGQRIRTVRLSEQMNRWKEQQSNQENVDNNFYKVPKKTESVDTEKVETFNDEKYVQTIEKEVSKVKHTVLKGFDKKLDREAQELKMSQELESKRSNLLDACLDVYDL